jgi:hypothetical protein
MADMVVDRSLKLRQDDTQFSLSLGSSDLRAQLTNTFVSGRWHRNGTIENAT